jgi:hypothetical protein
MRRKPKTNLRLRMKRWRILSRLRIRREIIASTRFTGINLRDVGQAVRQLTEEKQVGRQQHAKLKRELQQMIQSL